MTYSDTVLYGNTGGSALPPDDSSTSSGNYLYLNETKFVSPCVIYGGFSQNVPVINNWVRVDGVNFPQGSVIYGGYSVDGEVGSCPVDIFAINVEKVWGGYSQNSGVTGSRVVISGVVSGRGVIGEVVGAEGRTVSGGRVYIRGGETFGKIYGAKGVVSAIDNQVDIEGGATVGTISGAVSEGLCANNIVKLGSNSNPFGSVVTITGSIIGAETSSSTATNTGNTVRLHSGNILSPTVVGAHGGLSATDNAIYLNTIDPDTRCLGNATFGTETKFFGAYYDSDDGSRDFFSGNTLHKGNDTPILWDGTGEGNYGAQNFEYLKFYYDGAANIGSLDTTVRRPTEGIVKIDTDPENNGTGHAITFGGLIGGTGGLQKVGAGKLILSSRAEYTGALSVVGGTVVLDGVNQSATSVSVAPGATLAGTGTANASGAVTLAGTISPGVNAGAIGKLTFNSAGGDFVIKSTAILSIDLDAAAGADVVENFGDITIETGAQLLLASIGGDIVIGDEFTILSAVGGKIDGNFEQTEFELQGTSLRLVTVTRTRDGGEGEDLLLRVVARLKGSPLPYGPYATPIVPEPSVYALCGGLAALSFAAFRRHRKNRRR
ncbi:MAG: hypothetical protein LBG65_03415 [Puniceicoccales bacterium]|nr:hypothetical protein [Puniceicoccales bacterium]